MVRVKWSIKWNNTLLGKSKDFVVIDGIKYFSRDDLNMEYLKENGNQDTTEKGEIRFYDIVVGDEIYENGAWYYSNWKTSSRDFANYVAFAKDVTLEV